MFRTMSEENAFDVSHGFEVGESAGNVRLGKLEAMYEELFAEVIEDGIITTEERKQLDRMADSLGLDKTRLRKLETALQAAYEARHQIVIKDLSDTGELPPPMSITPLEPATDQRTLALERRVKFLEGRVKDLERDLEDARAQMSIEVDFSDASPHKEVPDDDPAELMRRVRADPKDDTSLRSLFRLYNKTGDGDRAFLVSQVLDHIGAANAEEKEMYAKYKQVGLIRPTAQLTQEAWRRLLFHPEEEPLVGEMFGVVVSAVLIGRLSALRRDKQLEKLDPEKKQDPAQSTLQAVRCFAWASQILGMQPPPLYVEPEFSGLCEMVPGVPPSSKLGAGVLSGRSAAELAFVAGQHLANYREEHFVRMLVPDARGLEDIFLAALSIGNPGLPLSAQVKQLVVPIARAIEPILEPQQIDRLRGHFLRFVEEGGRTNLQRWATSVDYTSNRAGLLLSGDLAAAANVLALQDKAKADDRVNDLLVFVLSDRYAKLRKQIGIAVA
jgi:hypothetical protein